MELLRTGRPLAAISQPIICLAIASIIVWAFEIVAATFIRWSPNSMAARLNVKLFSIAALLYIIVAVLVMFSVGA